MKHLLSFNNFFAATSATPNLILLSSCWKASHTLLHKQLSSLQRGRWTVRRLEPESSRAPFRGKANTSPPSSPRNSARLRSLPPSGPAATSEMWSATDTPCGELEASDTADAGCSLIFTASVPCSSIICTSTLCGGWLVTSKCAAAAAPAYCNSAIACSVHSLLCDTVCRSRRTLTRRRRGDFTIDCSSFAHYPGFALFSAYNRPKPDWQQATNKFGRQPVIYTLVCKLNFKMTNSLSCRIVICAL